MTTWTTEAKQIADSLLAPVADQLTAKQYTNITDQQDPGHQYVDLVCEGGGMYGIALVGYTYILESVGIRFRSIAGTSAGAINALLLAAVSGADESGVKSDKLLDIMGNKNFFDFVDGDGNESGSNPEKVRKIIDKALAGSRFGLLRYPFSLKAIYNNISNFYGLNCGQNFENWIEEILTNESAATLPELLAKVADFPPLFKATSDGKVAIDPAKINAELKLVAADITTESLAIFPEHAAVYYADLDAVRPAGFVRASMSIPGFFKPYECTNPSQDVDIWSTMRKIAPSDLPRDQYGNPTTPKKVLFVDGGILSNFPFDLLHEPTGEPNMPTFGVKLEVDYRFQKFSTFIGFIGAVFNTSRHSLNNAYNDNFSQEYKHLVKEIKIPEEISWLDFNMPKDKKIKLFTEGARCAIAFLQSFDWDKYRQVRRAANVAKSG